MKHLKRFLEMLLVPVLAAIVFFEDVLLHHLGQLMLAISRWPPIERLERWLPGLPPWAAVMVFAAPSILILPVKFAALWFALHQHYVLSIVSIVTGKLLATALVARLYKVLHPTLARIAWFVSAETWLFAWRDRLYAFVRALPAWQRAAALIQHAKTWVRSWLPAGRRDRVREWLKSSR